MRNRHGCPFNSHTLYRYLTYSVCCLLLLLSGCAAPLKPTTCTPRLTLHLLYPSASAQALTYRNPEGEQLYLSPTLLQCQHIDDVFYIYSMDGSGPTLRLDLAPQGQAILSQQTSEHVRGNLAILIDGQLLATPIIQMPIDGNSLLINGINDEVVAKSLVSSMKAQSNIGRYQVSAHRRAEVPVLFQAGMQLQPLIAQTTLPTPTDIEAEATNPDTSPSAPHTADLALADTTELDRQRQAPSANHEVQLGIALNKAELLQQTLPKLRAMNNSNYTIQLLATRNYPIAQALLQEPGIKSPLYLYRTWRSGQDWYLVVTGEFATLSEARSAATSEKMAQLYHDAWVKSVRKVHQELNANAPSAAKTNTPQKSATPASRKSVTHSTIPTTAAR
ncbi:MAG: SPOR domain-containing protein [Plesiomonas shigelloides]